MGVLIDAVLYCLPSLQAFRTRQINHPTIECVLSASVSVSSVPHDAVAVDTDQNNNVENTTITVGSRFQADCGGCNPWIIARVYNTSLTCPFGLAAADDNSHSSGFVFHLASFAQSALSFPPCRTVVPTQYGLGRPRRSVLSESSCWTYSSCAASS